MAEISTQEQIVREAPEIEAQKLALLQSSKAQVDATNLAAQQGKFLTPDYQIAGMTQNQLDAIRGGEAGIGAYQPYLSNAAQQLVGGQQTTGQAVDVLRGADTRNQFNTAQGLTGLAAQGTLNAAQPIGQAQISQYMNPYMNIALQQQLDEMNRQAQIQGQGLQAQATKARAAELHASVAGKTAEMYVQLQNTKLGNDTSIAVANINAATQLQASKIAASKETDLNRQTNIRYAALIEQGEPANKQTMAKAAGLAASDLGRYPGEAKAAAVAGERDAKFEARVDKALESNMPYLKAVQKGKTDEAARIRQGVVEELRATASQAAPEQQAAPAPQLSAVDKQALEWAKSNPNDPRAKAIRQRLGMGG